MKGNPAGPAILHLGRLHPFPQQLLAFLAARSELDEHLYLATDRQPPPLSRAVAERVRTGNRALFLARLAWHGARARKIVIHALFDPWLLLCLALQPWLLKKTCWILWGNDLYQYRIRRQTYRLYLTEALRRFVIGRVAQIASATPGDGELCRTWYRIRGEYINLFAYPNSILQPRPLPQRRPEDALRVLLGNSATASNQHADALRRLQAVDDGRLTVFCPLTYGDPAYRETVIDCGRRLFGERFRPLLENIALPDYLDFLAGIDIALFNHDRQQGMGNIRSLLGYGKKVYLQPGTTAWDHLHAMGLRVFNIAALDLEPDFPERRQNIAIIAERYSEQHYRAGLQTLFSPIGAACHAPESPLQG